jgi:hypothetical protein
MRRSIWVAAAIIATAACGKKEPVGPIGGNLTVSYDSPQFNDGALLVLVTGPVTAVTALGGYQMASAPAGSNATRVVLTGTLVTGDILRLAVPDISAASSYSVRVEAAADRTTFALENPSTYTASVRK